MEVLQIGPAAFGPQFVGPGTGSVGGCVFDASIGGVAYARLSKENNLKIAEDAMLVDAATARSERQGEIGHYKLLAKQTTYRDKITDQIINEKTLVSSDFNYEAAGVWTSAGEPGTVGTTSEYKGTVDRARELAQVDGDASMFWVSPSLEGESNRAYLWVKRGDEIDAYQYILPGSREAISKTMKSLGYRGNTRLLEEQTIIQKGSEQRIHHKDVYQALISSLSPKEITIAKPILDKFRQEIEIPDNTRKERLKSYQREYGTELNNERLKKEYKTDIGKWLESVIQGLVAIPGLVQGANGEKATVSQDTTALVKREEPVQAIIGNFANYDHFNEQRKNTTEEQLRRFAILQPIIPGIIGLTEIIAGYSKDAEGEKLAPKDSNLVSNGNISVKNQATEDELQLQIHKSNDDDQRLDKLLVADDYNPDFAEQLLWREFIAAIFVPTAMVGQSDEMLSDEGTEDGKVEKANGFLSEEINLKELLAEFVPVADELDVQNPLLVKDKEEKKVLVEGFQQGLEIIVQLVIHHEDSKLDQKQKEEKTRQIVVEEDVVRLGEKLLGMLVGELKISEGGKDKTMKPQIDALARLSFLLHVYKDPDSSEIVRSLLTSLIYKQIRIIMSENEVFTHNSKFREICRMFEKIAPRADFLEKRFDLLVVFLKKNYPADTFSEGENDDLISQIIYIIFQLYKPYFSFEKLPTMTGRKMQNIFSLQSNKKRKKQKQSRGGIIFGSHKGIIYEYYSLDLRFSREEYLRYLSRSVDV